MVARRGLAVFTGSGDTNLLTAFRFTDDGNSKIGRVVTGYHQVTGTLDVSGAVSASTFWGDGAGLTNVSASNITPGAPLNSVQFNDANSLGGDSKFTWTKTTDTLEVPIIAASGTLSLTAASTASLTLNSTADAEDLTIALAGATDSSLVFSSAGTGADAIQMSTSAGGIDIIVAGSAADDDLDLRSDSSINLISTEGAGDAIVLHANNAAGGIDLSVDSAVKLSLDTDSLDVSTGVILNVDDTTDASNITTGAVVVAGGIGVALQLHVGTNSTLGSDNQDVTSVRGRLGISTFNDGGSVAADEATLHTLAVTPSDYNGSMLYLGSTVPSGTLAGAYFANPDKWYFCESASWYPSPFNSL